MHIFVTGATGFVGSAVVAELLASGHRVTGLARSDRSAAFLDESGANVVPGSLDDLDVLESTAGSVNGAVHLAYKHEDAFGSGGHAVAAASDRAAVQALGRGLARSAGTIVVASTLTGHPHGVTITETDMAATTDGVTERLLTERVVLDLSTSGVRPAIVRMPPVHGEGDQSFIAWFVEIARRTGVAGFVGSGANRWPAVHVSDTARLFRLACESAPTGTGTVLHAVAEPGVPTKEIAGTIGRNLGVPAGPVEPDHFGWLRDFARFDIVATSTRTQDLLGWTASGPSLLSDLDEGHYFVSRG